MPKAKAALKAERDPELEQFYYMERKRKIVRTSINFSKDLARRLNEARKKHGYGTRQELIIAALEAYLKQLG